MMLEEGSDSGGDGGLGWDPNWRELELGNLLCELQLDLMEVEREMSHCRDHLKDDSYALRSRSSWVGQHRSHPSVKAKFSRRLCELQDHAGVRVTAQRFASETISSAPMPPASAQPYRSMSARVASPPQRRRQPQSFRHAAPAQPKFHLACNQDNHSWADLPMNRALHESPAYPPQGYTGQLRIPDRSNLAEREDFPGETAVVHQPSMRSSRHSSVRSHSDTLGATSSGRASDHHIAPSQSVRSGEELRVERRGGSSSSDSGSDTASESSLEAY
mmetsp:Transcript_35771/g.65664  ORF Transcript_35771/g.65664 Transcript_35771/m.65664 type:complete len:274 (+) Transcript_35771:56-877(+)